MAKYRQIHLSFWQDPFVEELEPLAKYFYLYLMTNSKTTQCGCYEISHKLIRYETGLTDKEINSYIKLFEESNKIRYNSENMEFLILNWLKHNSFKSPKVLTCIKNEMITIKTEEYIRYINSILNGETCMDRLLIDYARYIDTGSQEEKEKEQKEEQKEKSPASLLPNEKNKCKDLSDFDEIRKLFKGSKTVSVAKNKLPVLIKKYSKEQIIRTVERYNQDVIKKRIKQPNLNYMNESTFWNGRFEDYLDEFYDQKEAQKEFKPFIPEYEEI
jgi:hypothetical protein